MRTVRLYRLARCLGGLLLALWPAFASADWDFTDGAKWIQPPDTTPLGTDVAVGDHVVWQYN
jgi:hypothetical protein